MQTDMEGVFTIDGPLVKFSQLQLRSDGSRSDITGVVDTSKWPEQTWQVKSVVDFPRMREIFFAREKWVLGGEGHFTGVFHLFKGGRELKGDFTSAEARVNSMRFPKLAGSLIWVPDRFEVTEAEADFYGGRTHFGYGLKPLGKAGVRPTASFDAEFDRVDLATLGTAFEWAGHPADRRHVGLHEAPLAQRPLCREAWRRRPDLHASRRTRSSRGASCRPMPTSATPPACGPGAHSTPTRA